MYRIRTAALYPANYVLFASNFPSKTIILKYIIQKKIKNRNISLGQDSNAGETKVTQ